MKWSQKRSVIKNIVPSTRALHMLNLHGPTTKKDAIGRRKRKRLNKYLVCRHPYRYERTLLNPRERSIMLILQTLQPILICKISSPCSMFSGLDIFWRSMGYNFLPEYRASSVAMQFSPHFHKNCMQFSDFSPLARTREVSLFYRIITRRSESFDLMKQFMFTLHCRWLLVEEYSIPACTMQQCHYNSSCRIDTEFIPLPLPDSKCFRIVVQFESISIAACRKFTPSFDDKWLNYTSCEKRQGDLRLCCLFRLVTSADTGR